MADITFLRQNTHDFCKEVCFAAEWVKQNGEMKATLSASYAAMMWQNSEAAYKMTDTAP